LLLFLAKRKRSRSKTFLWPSRVKPYAAPIFIGKDQGFFTAEGIDLKLVLIPVSVAQMAIMAQQVDGMEYSGNGVSMRANGAPVAMVFSETYKPSWFLFANSPIKHLKHLSGKSVSVGVPVLIP